MYHIVYMSTASSLMREPDLADILAIARTNNLAQAITGVLFYAHETFFQLLEGEKAVVQQLYRKIAADPRHHDADILLEIETAQRICQDWSMGFHSLDQEKLLFLKEMLIVPEDVIKKYEGNPNVISELLLNFIGGVFQDRCFI